MSLHELGYKRQCKTPLWMIYQRKEIFPLLLTLILPAFPASEQLLFKVRQEFTNLFHRLLLITGGSLDKSNLPVMCNLQCGLWQLVLLWACSPQSFSGVGNALEWNSWKKWAWIWFIPALPLDFLAEKFTFWSWWSPVVVSFLIWHNCGVLTAKHFRKLLITQWKLLL